MSLFNRFSDICGRIMYSVGAMVNEVIKPIEDHPLIGISVAVVAGCGMAAAVYFGVAKIVVVVGGAVLIGGGCCKAHKDKDADGKKEQIRPTEPRKLEKQAGQQVTEESEKIISEENTNQRGNQESEQNKLLRLQCAAMLRVLANSRAHHENVATPAVNPANVPGTVFNQRPNANVPVADNGAASVPAAYAPQ